MKKTTLILLLAICLLGCGKNEFPQASAAPVSTVATVLEETEIETVEPEITETEEPEVIYDYKLLENGTTVYAGESYEELKTFVNENCDYTIVLSKYGYETEQRYYFDNFPNCHSLTIEGVHKQHPVNITDSYATTLSYIDFSEDFEINFDLTISDCYAYLIQLEKFYTNYGPEDEIPTVDLNGHTLTLSGYRADIFAGRLINGNIIKTARCWCYLHAFDIDINELLNVSGGYFYINGRGRDFHCHKQIVTSLTSVCIEGAFKTILIDEVMLDITIDDYGYTIHNRNLYCDSYTITKLSLSPDAQLTKYHRVILWQEFVGGASTFINILEDNTNLTVHLMFTGISTFIFDFDTGETLHQDDYESGIVANKFLFYWHNLTKERIECLNIENRFETPFNVIDGKFFIIKTGNETGM